MFNKHAKFDKYVIHNFTLDSPRESVSHENTAFFLFLCRFIEYIRTSIGFSYIFALWVYLDGIWIENLPGIFFYLFFYSLKWWWFGLVEC